MYSKVIGMHRKLTMGCCKIHLLVLCQMGVKRSPSKFSRKFNLIQYNTMWNISRKQKRCMFSKIEMLKRFIQKICTKMTLIIENFMKTNANFEVWIIKKSKN